MLIEMRPPVKAETVLTCCTNKVGDRTPGRAATMNLIRWVFMPRAAESVIGSGRVKPKAISSESIPHSSARRQNSTWRSRLSSPAISVVALVLRSLSPTCDKLQWNRKGISAFLELTLRMTVQADLIESHPDQTVN